MPFAFVALSAGAHAGGGAHRKAAPHAILLYAGRTVERLAARIWAVPLSLALGLANRA